MSEYKEKCHTPSCRAIAIGPGCVIAFRPRAGKPGTKWCYVCSKRHANTGDFSGSGVRVLRSALQAITESVATLTKLRDAIGKQRGASDEHRKKEFEVTASIAVLRQWYETLADSDDA
jgi:hypothetical protein